ncbi:MAG TPA: hypothetical protein VE548_08795 [Nitrososphaeraceae archaeon]|jgi:hypothetical protein|nr:hypothetical protein [Nitrososphaeraceae archaeon]
MTYKTQIAIAFIILHLVFIQSIYLPNVANAQVSNNATYASNSEIYGVSYSEWTAKWWQWFLAMPEQGHPVRDLTGEKCSVNQSGPVWFLLGAWFEAERSCEIPFGKSILFPIVNTECSPAEPGMQHFKTETELRECAVSGNDGMKTLIAKLDNQELPNLWQSRVQSPPFNATYPEGAVFDATKGTFLDVSDGYWVFLKPLTKGEHEIYWEYVQVIHNPDTGDVGQSAAKVTYHLNVR